MRKFIVKTNEWYDNLKEPKRSIMFLVFIMSTLLIAQYFMVVCGNPWIFVGWTIVLISWRMSYSWLKFTKWYKKTYEDSTRD